MVAVRIIVVVAVALALTSSTGGETQAADCLNRCISRCVDTRGGLCSFNCAIGCKWPFSQPTGEVLVTSPNDNMDPAAMQAAFAIHDDPQSRGTQPAPPPTAPTTSK